MDRIFGERHVNKSTRPFAPVRIGILAMFSLTFFAGCSSFSRDYKKALAEQRPAGSIEGPWNGTWTSNGGHAGSLKCLLTRNGPAQSDAGAPTTYRARFEATFWKVFTGRYDVTLSGKENPDGTAHLTGDQDLGKMVGGVFHYDAHVTPTNFDATYESSKDDGKFTMKRP
jgi:hypothetical protein